MRGGIIQDVELASLLAFCDPGREQLWVHPFIWNGRFVPRRSRALSRTTPRASLSVQSSR